MSKSRPNKLSKEEQELWTMMDEMRTNLDLQRGRFGKYFKVNGNNPLYNNLNGATHSSARDEFLKHKFKKFYQAIHIIANYLQDADVQSIGSESETPLITELKTCLDILNKAGFYNVNNKPINLWSGEKASLAAAGAATSLSNSNVPAISVIINFFHSFSNNNLAHYEKLVAAVSALFACQAEGDVYMYQSAHRPGEQPTVIAGNFNWNFELFILRKLQQKGVVHSIKAVYQDPNTNKWDRVESIDEPQTLITRRDKTTGNKPRWQFTVFGLKRLLNRWKSKTEKGVDLEKNEVAQTTEQRSAKKFLR